MTQQNSETTTRDPGQPLVVPQTDPSVTTTTFDKTAIPESLTVFVETAKPTLPSLSAVGKFLFIMLLLNFIVVICLL